MQKKASTSLFTRLRPWLLGLVLLLVAMNLVSAVTAYHFGKLSDSVSHTKVLAFGLNVLIQTINTYPCRSDKRTIVVRGPAARLLDPLGRNSSVCCSP